LTKEGDENKPRSWVTSSEAIHAPRKVHGEKRRKTRDPRPSWKLRENTVRRPLGESNFSNQRKSSNAWSLGSKKRSMNKVVLMVWRGKSLEKEKGKPNSAGGGSTY